jgi:alpha-methylacyl-CoA racemase
VLTLTEAPDHPHNVARTSYTTVGDAVVADAAPRFSATPAAAGALTPVGRDTGALLGQLGYDAAAIDELRAAGTIV